MDEKRIEKMMKSLGVTREEAISIIREDDEVDGMSMKEVTSDLTAEQRKTIKNATKTTSKKREATKRERKVDETKKAILEILDGALFDELNIVSEWENEVALHFTYEGAKYDLKLIKHRPPKASK